jgi:hypothetical protein
MKIAVKIAVKMASADIDTGIGIKISVNTASTSTSASTGRTIKAGQAIIILIIASHIIRKNAITSVTNRTTDIIIDIITDLATADAITDIGAIAIIIIHILDMCLIPAANLASAAINLLVFASGLAAVTDVTRKIIYLCLCCQ